MSRRKLDRTVWQHKFNLSSAKADDVRLHEHLLELADDAKAAQWIRDSLVSLLPSKPKHGNTVVLPTNDLTYETVDD